MSKILFWAVVIVLALLGMRLAARHAVRDKSATPPPGAPGRPRQQSPVSMVQCAHCGVYLPDADAVRADGRHWCCLEHARLGGVK